MGSNVRRRRRVGGIILGAGGGATASEQLLTLATDDGWTYAYDVTNPNTLTTREDGGTTYVTAVADGLGNGSDMVQTTAANQPELRLSAFGELDALYVSGTAGLTHASANSTIAQPVRVISVVEIIDDLDLGRFFAKSTGDAFRSYYRITNDFITSRSDTILDTPSDTLAVNQKAIISWLFAGTGSKIFINSAEVASGDTGTNPYPATITWGNREDLDRGLGGNTALHLVGANISDAKHTAMLDLIHDLTGISKA